MKIYISGNAHDDFPRFLWRAGEHYLLTLYGVNIVINENQAYVEPVYQPRLTISKSPNWLVTLRLWNMIYLNAIFMTFYPWIKVYRTNAIQLGIEEDE